MLINWHESQNCVHREICFFQFLIVYQSSFFFTFDVSNGLFADVHVCTNFFSLRRFVCVCPKKHVESSLQQSHFSHWNNEVRILVQLILNEECDRENRNFLQFRAEREKLSRWKGSRTNDQDQFHSNNPKRMLD
jgi:hypothetical protein